MNHSDYINEAIKLAFEGMRTNKGGPFGAVVVKDDAIIGKGCNMVTSTNDPTAHAEIIAIRDACRNLGNFQPGGATLYASSEPCPMCLAAIYWADIKAVYYSADKLSAEKIGFDDQFIYDEFKLPIEDRSINMQQIPSDKMKVLFKEWTDKQDKVPY